MIWRKFYINSYHKFKMYPQYDSQKINNKIQLKFRHRHCCCCQSLTLIPNAQFQFQIFGLFFSINFPPTSLNNSRFLAIIKHWTASSRRQVQQWLHSHMLHHQIDQIHCKVKLVIRLSEKVINNSLIYRANWTWTVASPCHCRYHWGSCCCCCWDPASARWTSPNRERLVELRRENGGISWASRTNLEPVNTYCGCAFSGAPSSSGTTPGWPFCWVPSAGLSAPDLARPGCCRSGSWPAGCEAAPRWTSSVPAWTCSCWSRRCCNHLRDPEKDPAIKLNWSIVRPREDPSSSNQTHHHWSWKLRHPCPGSGSCTWPCRRSARTAPPWKAAGRTCHRKSTPGGTPDRAPSEPSPRGRSSGCTWSTWRRRFCAGGEKKNLKEYIRLLIFARYYLYFFLFEWFMWKSLWQKKLFCIL